MKKLAYILLGLGFLMILFQVAIWIVTKPPNDKDLLNTFWYILKIIIPGVLGIITFTQGASIEEKENIKKDRFL